MPYDVELLARGSSDVQLAANAAASALQVFPWIDPEFDAYESTLWNKSMDALTSTPAPALQDTANALAAALQEARLRSRHKTDHYRALQLLHALVSSAASYDRASCVRVCVQCADLAYDHGETGDLEWLKQAWSEVGWRP